MSAENRHDRRSHHVDRLGGTIRYDVVGDGSLHFVAWPAGTRPLDDLVPFAEQLVDRCDARVALIQPRGCPGSTLPVGGHTLADLAGDVVAVLLALGSTPVLGIGHAFGNRIMRMTATLRPDLLDGLVLFAAGGLFGPTSRFTEDMAIVGNTELPTPERVEALGRCYFEPGRADPSAWLDPPSADAGRITRVVAEPPHVWWDGGSAPMLVVQGADDQSATPENGLALAAAHPGRVSLQTIEGGAHALPLDRPAECARLVVAWLTLHDLAHR